MAPAVRRLLLVASLFVPTVTFAQGTGTVTGRVTVAATGVAAAGARIDARLLPSRLLAGSATTTDDGRYTLTQLEAGTYILVVSRLGYSPLEAQQVVVEEGQVTRQDIALSNEPVRLATTVVTGTATPQSAIATPNQVSVVTSETIRNQPAVTPADYLRGLPGIDVASNGIGPSNIVARGFNNAFSGSLLMLQDNRFASVPSLRVNIPLLLTSTNEDIERIEVVLGPGSALYGPNASNGVMHVITKSPFQSQGTTLTIDGGERSLFRLGARHAGTLGERVGFKLSGEWLRAREWQYDDPAEPATFAATPSTPAARIGQPNTRDFDLERIGGEARLDFRLPGGGEWSNSYGLARIGNSLELTGANGTAQIRDWTMQHLQTRFRRGRFFAQAFGNMSDAGNESRDDLGGTFLLRTGQPIVDQSRVGALQLQQGFEWGSRQTFLVGGDYIYTNPRTDSTINGRNEEDDDFTEAGAYIHSVTQLSDRFELVTAFRADVNSRLDGRFYSPRAALVYNPDPMQSFRVTYNRAYSTPSNFNLFLDLLQGSLRPTTGLPYDIRALGVPQDGFTFRRNCTDGINNLCMRSPVPYANGSVTANAYTDAVGYQNALAIAVGAPNGGLIAGIAAGIRANAPQISPQTALAMAQAAVGRMAGLDPNAATVGSNLRIFNPSLGAQAFATPYSADSVVDIAPLKATFVNNFEVGYKRNLAGLRVDVAGWYQRRENFITAALNVTPTVFVGAAQTAALINPEMRIAFRDELVRSGVPPAQADGFATQLAAGISQAVGGQLASIPAGNVVPDSRLTANGDFAFTYRNIDQTIDLFGSDLAVWYDFTRRYSMSATYSWVSEAEFPEVDNGGAPLSLNAPTHKATLGARWADDARHYRAELRGRYTNAFTVNSGVFFGHVPVNTTLDASVSWDLPFGGRRTTFAINATNVFDNRRASFVGVPEIGRLVITRLQHTF